MFLLSLLISSVRYTILPKVLRNLSLKSSY